MTQTPTKAEELAARAETLAIAEALERRFGCSALVLTADIERAAAELRRLSAENTAAVSSFLAADDERRELRAERDALQSKVQEMALQALADDTQHREVEAERDALLAAIPDGCTPADAATLRAANHQLAAERDALAARPAVPAGFVLVPVEVLEDAATAIGNFVSDHGWSDEDMQAMDNLDAYIARHKANAAPATPAQMVSEDFQCADHDSPWLICKTCAADGKCARATPSPAPAEQAQAGDRAMASDWSWTGVRMELEASGRDDLSAWVSQQIEPKAHAGEPVVPYLYVYEYDSPFGLNREFYPSGWNGQKPTRTVPLYTTPQPAQAERVGLTDEQIAEGRYRTWAAEPEDAPEAWSFLRGARWAESALAVRWGVKLGATTGKEPGNV